MPLETTDARSPPLAPVEVPTIASGRSIGSYTIGAKLGSGGMGEVYLADDARLGRKVAIKVVRPDRPGATDLLAEARAMARLSHPNVVTVYEVGTVGDEVYVAMEYVAGHTLRAWLAAAPRHWRDVVLVLVAAGRGLAAAHAAGIVHRDFKPENVLVGDDGRVRVGDFGLAAAATGDREPDPDADVAATLKFSAVAFGTPAYMAPEQHLRTHVDARADQFAFAVALYEGLSGEWPFPGRTLAEIRGAVLAGIPPRQPPRVPSWLHAAVIRGLAFDRDARFPSMDVFLRAIDRDPVARRRRLGLALAVLATGGGVAALGFVGRAPAPPPCDGGTARLATVWNPGLALMLRGTFLATGRPYAGDTADRVVSALDRYGAAWSAMHREACESSLLRHEQSSALFDLRMACLDRRLGAFGALVRELGSRPDARVLDRAPRAVAELARLDDCAATTALTAAVPPPDDPALRAQVAALRPLLDRAHAVALTGGSSSAGTLAREVVAAARAVRDDATLAEALHRAALLARTAGDAAYAESCLREALPVAARARDDRRVVELWGQLLPLIGEAGRIDEALALWPAAEAAVARVGDVPRAQGKVLNAQGSVYISAGRNAEAAAAFRRSLPLFAEDPVQRLIVENNLGLALLDTGDLDGAAAALGQARDLAAEVYGPESPWMGYAILNLASVHMRQGRLGEARAMLERAVSVCQRALGADNGICAKGLNNLAYVDQSSGRLDEALGTYRQALAIKERSFGPDHPDTLSSVENLAQVYLLLVRYREALPLSERAVATRDKVLGAGNVAVAESLVTRGRIEAGLGRLAAARADEARALAIAEKAAGANTLEVADVRQALGELALVERRRDLALVEYRSALALRERLLGPAHPAVAAALAGVGEAWLASGRAAEAVGPLERAVAIREAAEGDPHDLAVARLLLARAVRGEPAKAARLASMARVQLEGEGERGRRRVAEIDR